MFTQLGTRQRIMLSSIIIGVFSFLLISPFLNVLLDYVMPPSIVKNITVSKTSVGEINIKWERGQEYDLSGYKIKVDEQEETLDSGVDNYTVRGLDQLTNYTISIGSFDTFGNVSEITRFKYSDIQNVITLNTTTELPFIFGLVVKSLILSLVVFILTAWSLFYKFTRKNIVNIVLIPAFTLIPLLMLAVTTVETINLIVNKFVGSIGLSIVFVVVAYISLLTTNILNASLTIKLPLEQAAKATHFILSLISTYLVLIYAFGSYQNILFRLIVLIPFIFIYTYTGLTVNKSSSKIALIKTLGISLTVVLASVVASVWPVEVAYAILMIAVVYYILLNLALEVRTRYTQTLWVEYFTLVLLILILFFTTSTWGINFSII